MTVRRVEAIRRRLEPKRPPRIGNRRVRTVQIEGQVGNSTRWVRLEYLFDGVRGMRYTADGDTTTEATRRAARGVRLALVNMQTGARPQGWDQ